MAIKSVQCHVLQANVTVVTDLEGAISRVICPEYDAPFGICRLKQSAASGGPLSQLIERVSEETLNSRSTRCDIAA